MEKRMKKIILIYLCFIAACLPIKAKQSSSEQKSSIKSKVVLIKLNGRDCLLDRELGVICYFKYGVNEITCIRMKSI